jgi:hypothetical protein
MQGISTVIDLTPDEAAVANRRSRHHWWWWRGVLRMTMLQRRGYLLRGHREYMLPERPGVLRGAYLLRPCPDGLPTYRIGARPSLSAAEESFRRLGRHQQGAGRRKGCMTKPGER